MIISKQVLWEPEDVRAFYAEATGMRPDYMQLSGGVSRINFTAIEYDGVAIVWTASEGRQFWRDVIARGPLHFGCLIESAGPARVFGQELSPDQAMAWTPGQTMDYVLEGPLLSLEIGVSERLVEELGWTISDPPVRTVPKDRLDRLTEICRTALQSNGQSAGEPEGAHGRVAQMVWRDTILEALESALEPWLSDPTPSGSRRLSTTAGFKTFRKSDAFFESTLNAGPLEIDAIARSIGVSRRTIYHAFRESLGIGPYRYFQLKRLHQLRAQLLEADPAKETVTSAASELGFSELGRLAQNYKNQFGEYPSQTLKRSPLM